MYVIANRPSGKHTITDSSVRTIKQQFQSPGVRPEVCARNRCSVAIMKVTDGMQLFSQIILGKQTSLAQYCRSRLALTPVDLPCSCETKGWITAGKCDRQEYPGTPPKRPIYAGIIARHHGCLFF